MLLASLIPTNQWIGHAAEQFTDIDNSWAREQISDWLQKGLISGYTDKTFRPNDKISRAEFVSVINKIFGYKDTSGEEFKDVSKNKWYYEEIYKARQAGYISGYADGTFKPDKYISRQEAATIIFNLLKLNKIEDRNALTAFKDSKEIRTWSKDNVNAVVANGYMIGYTDHSFRPEQLLTRAEAVVLLDRIAGNLITSSGTYGPNDEQEIVHGNMTINTDDVSLRNTIIKGDLYLAAGIGEGEVLLDNVTVEGRTIVNGGGENSVIFINSIINIMIIDKNSGKVRVLTKDDTEISSVVVKSAAILEEENKAKGFGEIEIDTIDTNESIDLKGEFNKVIIRTKVNLEIFEDTKIEELETDDQADGSSINMREKSVVVNIVINVATKITGTGDITFAYINSDGSSIDVNIEKYQISQHVQIIIINGIETTENLVEEDIVSTPSDDGSTQTPPQQPEQELELEVQGAFIIEDKLYSKFSTSGDYSPYSWTINSTATQDVYQAQYSSTNGEIGIFTINAGVLNGAEYNAILEDTSVDYYSVMLSTKTVTDEVYGYVYYGGSNNISFDINTTYHVSDLNQQINEGATPLSNGDVITLYYGDYLVLEAEWNDVDKKWQFGNIIDKLNLDTPTNLMAETISNTEIGLSWDQVSGADYYHIYYSDAQDGVYTPITDMLGAKKQIVWQTGVTYIDGSNLPNTTRYYKVAAVYNTLESGLSNIAFATTYHNYHIELNFNITDTVQHPVEPIIFITDKENKKLYSVNYETEQISSVTFDLSPESLTYANGEVYVSLLKGAHSSYWSAQQGAIAIVDAETLAITAILDINIDPYDIVVDRNGYFYVSAGSDQWTDITSYSRVTLEEVASSGIRQQSYVQMHPTMDKLYTITTESSPRDITAYNVLNGTYVEAAYPGGYDSPYHGDYEMNMNFNISPDGKYIFNGAGTVFNSSNSQYDDMKYVYRLNSSFADIAFDLNVSKFYTANNNQVHVYNYENFEQIGKYNTDGSTNALFNSVDQLVAISVLNGNNIIEIIEKSSMETIPPVEYSGIKFDGTIVDVQYDSINGKVYAIDEAFRNLYTVDLASQSIVNTVKLPYKPSSLTLSEDGAKLYIVNDNENNLVTEVRLSDYTIVRHLNYVSTPDSRDFSQRHIYNNAGYLYVVMGDWEPTLLVFDETTFGQVTYSPSIIGIGDMAFTSDNSKFYYWYQYGWDAGNAGSDVYAYSISGTTFTKTDQSQLGYPNMGRDPLDTPILLLEGKGIVIAKDKVFSINDLSQVVGEFPEAIYAVSPSGDTVVGKNGVYDVNSYQKIETLSLETAIKIFYDYSGTLYYLIDNTLFSK